MILFRVYCCLAAILLQAVLLGNSVRAQTSYSEIVYNEQTKSYFQYVQHDILDGKNWAQANALASKLTYKGVRGRLAVVPDQEVNAFLRQTFAPGVVAWIGLRYFCRHKTLLWVDGQILERTRYQNWATPWYRTQAITCQSQPGAFEYMPVYYTATAEGFRWQASGPLKGFYGYFVEFPTGSR